MKKHNVIEKYIRLVILAFVSIIVLGPIAYMFNRSLLVYGFENYVYIFKQKSVNIFANFMNSLLVCGLTILLVVMITSLAAYAFSKLNFSGKNVLYLILMIGLMVPPAAIILPVFQTVKAFGLINKTISLVGPYTAMFAIFNLTILKNYYDTLPNQLLESAYIDGCSSIRTFTSIILPLSYPSLIVVVVWTFLNSWKELLLAMIFIQDVSKSTLTVIPVKLAYAFNQYAYQGRLFAALTVTLVPVIILYMFLQKYFVYGITGGAVKG